MKHHLRIVITFSVLLFVGCNASTTGQLGEGAGNQKSSQVDSAFDDVEAKFSELGSEFIRKGRFIPAKNISQIVDGKSQTEVQELLGEPDAIRGSNKQWWFYNINLPLDNFGGSLVCQYRVSFTEGYVISGTAWRRPPCQNLYTSILTKEMSKPESQEVILSGEVLFSYDSAELTRPGKQELDKVAAKFFSQLQRIRVTVLGHTDRIGSETYNLALSQRRADSVEAYLSSLKYAPSNIIAGGRGSREPLVSCEGTIVTPELKDCLAPNRRVQLIIEGLQEEI
jgi:outer membrane protein OmpA-like peptidoglycan-associated protein